MRETAISLVKTLQNADFVAYFAGGCVRDSLLGRDPKDYDIATNATPQEILKLFPKADSIGAHFGVILVKESGYHFEIATFRKDGDYSDGRRPDSVSFTDAETDAQRRDFTINGLFEDPIAGQIIDFVDGQIDLDKQQLRAIGIAKDRFAEDYLRLLRAVRFASIIDFEIEPTTWQAVKAEANNIGEIAPERIREELDKIWRHPNRLKGFDLLVKSGLMQQILPEIINLQGCEQQPKLHPEDDVFAHTRLMLELLKPDASLPLVLSVLFHDIAKPSTHSHDTKRGAEMTTEILKRLKYSNQIIDATVAAVAHLVEFSNAQNMRISTLKRLIARQTFDDELELHRVDCQSSHGSMENYQFLREKRKEYIATGEPIIPPPLINGHDLIQAGVTPGPEMANILTEAQDLQLEGELAEREAALQWLQNRIGA